MRGSTIVVLIALLAFAALSPARQAESWPYERLFKEASLIVIATPMGTVVTDDRMSDPLYRDYLIGQNTTFKIESVIKGQAAGPITVLHFKAKPGQALQNGPFLVSFHTKTRMVTGTATDKQEYKAELGPPQYLLFLKISDKGRFEPVSGQVDPIWSVKEMYTPPPVMISEP